MKKQLYILSLSAVCALVLMAFSVKAPLSIQEEQGASLSDSAKVDTVIKRAYSVMGIPYKWAGATPQSGFDCSGFLYWCYKPTGVVVARSSKGLYNMGTPVEIEEAQKGDIILFRGTNPNDKSVGHVGIVVSEKGQPLKFVHSSSSKKHWGVVETEYGGSYYIKRYVGIRRVFFLEDKK